MLRLATCYFKSSYLPYRLCLIEVVDTAVLSQKLVPRGAVQRRGANLAVKCRSWRGWDTMRIPGSAAARPATRVTTSMT